MKVSKKGFEYELHTSRVIETYVVWLQSSSVI